MRRLLSLILLLGAAQVCAAQSVKLPAEVKADVGRLASVVIEYSGDDLKWVVPPALDCFREYDPLATKIRLRLIGYVAGTYDLSATAAAVVNGKAVMCDPAHCQITIGAGTPVPPPPGPPPPPNPPPPSAKVAWAVVVEDAANRSPQTAGVLGDVAFWNALGVPWHRYDLNEPMPDGLKAAADKAGSYPALVLLGAMPAGSTKAPLLRSVPLPATKDAVKAEVLK